MTNSILQEYERVWKDLLNQCERIKEGDNTYPPTPQQIEELLNFALVYAGTMTAFYPEYGHLIYSSTMALIDTIIEHDKIPELRALFSKQVAEIEEKVQGNKLEN